MQGIPSSSIDSELYDDGKCIRAVLRLCNEESVCGQQAHGGYRGCDLSLSDGC